MSAPEPFMYESGTYYWSGHVDKFAAECETCETYGSVLEIFLVAHTHVRRVRDYEDGCIEDASRGQQDRIVTAALPDTGTWRECSTALRRLARMAEAPDA